MRRWPSFRSDSPYLAASVGVTDNERRVQSIERFEQVAKTTPREAALRIIDGIESNKPRVVIGSDARMMDILQRLRPATYWRVLARRIGKTAQKK